MKRFLYIVLFCLLAASVNAATYNYYFDTTGGGSTCSIGSPCALLSDAETKANAHNAVDIVNLYFQGGQTWTESTDDTNGNFQVNYGEAAVNMLSYGTGRAIIDGGIAADFSGAPVSHSGGGAFHYNTLFVFQTPNSSIDNIEIKNVYGNVIRLDGYAAGSCITLDCADGFTLSDSIIHNFGSAAITAKDYSGIEDVTITRNQIYLGARIPEKSLCSGSTQNCWPGAVNLLADQGLDNDDALCQNNTVTYNLIYDIYGEGINNPNGTTAWNVIGDTGSIAIDTSAHDWDTLTTVVKYNLIIHSDKTSSIYDNMPSTSQSGIRIFDEAEFGDNTAADISVYGNIVINAAYGLRLYCGAAWCSDLNKFGSVKIYNNLFIDNSSYNIFTDSPDIFDYVYLYNNVSILYDRAGSNHTNAFVAGANWDIDKNAFWTTGGSPSYDSDYSTNVVITDPKIPGEEQGTPIDWDGLSSIETWPVSFTTHLLIGTDSPLYNVGKALSNATFIDDFLATGSDFEDVSDSTSTFNLFDQDDYTPWEIGPWVYGAAAASSDQIQGAVISGGKIN